MGAKSPSKIPARAPLSNLNHGGNSPERRARPESRNETIRGKMGPPPRAPPPKMRDLFEPQPAPTPITHFRAESVASSGSVRHVEPEDTFYDGEYPPQQHTRPQPYHELKSSMRQNEQEPRMNSSHYSGPPSRQISNTSNATVSGSENWQTIEDDSEPEQDYSEAYYARLRAARAGKRFTPEDYSQGGQVKKQKGIPPYNARAGLADTESNRIVSGSEANWTDEDAF
jgi:protein regulator of cytokinesis 1